MPTATYEKLDLQYPNTTPAVPRQQNMTKVRTNTAALRDMIVAGGMPYGWDMSLEGADPAKPDAYLFTFGTERIRAACTWGTTGGAANNVTKAAFYYSSDSGVSYVPLKDPNDNYVVTMTYNANFICTATTWGATP